MSANSAIHGWCQGLLPAWVIAGLLGPWLLWPMSVWMAEHGVSVCKHGP
jgi:hypothetical protein